MTHITNSLSSHDKNHFQRIAYFQKIIVSHRFPQTFTENLIPKYVNTFSIFVNTVEHVYNDIGLYDTSSITSDVLWHQLIPHFCITLYTSVITTKSIHDVVTDFDLT